jgi:hypothetical protein
MKYKQLLAFARSTFLLCLCQSVMAQDFEFLFWPTKGAGQDTRVLRTEEGACGNLLLAKVQKMPNPTKGDVLATDTVYELSANSRIIRHWYVPANALPVATAGDELVFSDIRGTYAVSTSGAIRGFSSTQAFPASAEVKCHMPKDFKGSGYARCHSFPQITGKKTSILAFQGPCT